MRDPPDWSEIFFWSSWWFEKWNQKFKQWERDASIRTWKITKWKNQRIVCRKQGEFIVDKLIWRDPWSNDLRKGAQGFSTSVDSPKVKIRKRNFDFTRQDHLRCQSRERDFIKTSDEFRVFSLKHSTKIQRVEVSSKRLG